MVIDDYSINGYWWLFYCGYFINGYLWLLVAILLMAISG
jgi:hypothetical protein